MVLRRFFFLLFFSKLFCLVYCVFLVKFSSRRKSEFKEGLRFFFFKFKKMVFYILEKMLFWGLGRWGNGGRRTEEV